MATTNPSPETNGGTDLERIADDRPEIARDANIVGVDGEGCVHYHSPRADHVWVVTPDPETPIASVLTHEQTVYDIYDWIDHTRTCRGAWRDLRYGRGSAFAAIAATVREVADGAQ